MSDLLKEAIADAKAVRETALENAKMALEEAFTPHLKSMLSAKLSEDDVEEGMYDREEDDEEKEEGMDDSDRKPREDDDEEMDEMDSDRKPREDDDEEMDEMGHEDDEEEVDEAEIIEIDGVKYAPVVSEEEHEDEDEDDMEEELDLESVIKELETEIAESEESDEDSVNEGEHEDEDEKDEVDEEIVVEEDEEDLDEQSKSSGIGAGDNKVKQASPADEEDPGKGKMKESVNPLQTELNEYKEAVVYLKDKLHEVNILNAKLLFTNRLFKEFVLSNDQKMKVVETFDRAQTTREIKLVYSTLAESFNDRQTVKKNSIKESASQKTGTTAPKKKIISEEDNVANRFKKLAGILKD